MKFQVGDTVRLASILPPNDQYLVALSKIAAENHGVPFDAIQTVTNSTERGFVTTDLMGGPWQEERFDLVEEARVPTTNPFSWSGGNAEACATDEYDQFDVLKKWSTPFSEMSIGDNTQSPYPDNVTLPGHYARFKIEPVNFITANKLDFFQGNIIKYTCRHDAKNGIEDLKKARRYLDMYIKYLEGDEDYWK